jgi:DNA-binding XRE family transcriptional regulator
MRVGLIMSELVDSLGCIGTNRKGLATMKIRLIDGSLYGYCKAQGISRDELSRRMGVATTTAFRVEKGDVAPSAKFIAGLLHVTGMEFEALFEIVVEDEVGVA